MEENQDITLEDALCAEVMNLLSSLEENFEPGTKEYSEVVEDVCKISKVIIQFEEKNERIGDNWIKHEADVKRADEELNLKKEQLKIDTELRKKEISDKKIGQYINYGINTAGIIIPIIFYNTWMKKGFKFEETGTLTSSTFRGLYKLFKPTKVD